MLPSLSALERKILEIVHADHRRGRRSTLATIEIALDEADAKRVGNSLIGRSCWDLEKLGLLSTVKPAVTISAKGSAVIGKPVETPEPEAAPETVKPVQPKAIIPPALAFPPLTGETGLNVARRLLQSRPEGVTTAQANQWTGLKLGSRFSELIACGDVVGSTGRPAVYRLASFVADDASPGVAPAPVASPEAGPATAEDVSAVAVVAPVADAAPAMVVEMVEAVADAIVAESLSDWLAAALSRVVGDGYHVEVDESEPCGVIIGTPGQDEVINVEICAVPGSAERHILWISPQGGMGVSFDDALLAAIRAMHALTAPDKEPFIPEDAKAPAEAHRELLSALNCASPGRYDLLADTWEDALEEVRRLARGRERHDEIVTANAKTIAELRKGLADAKDGGTPHQLLANALGISQNLPTAELITQVRLLIEHESRLTEACAGNFAIDLADALGVNIEDTDPSSAVATLLDEVRRRKPVARLLAEAEVSIVRQAQEDRNHLHAAARLLGVM